MINSLNKYLLSIFCVYDTLTVLGMYKKQLTSFLPHTVDNPVGEVNNKQENRHIIC